MKVKLVKHIILFIFIFMSSLFFDEAIKIYKNILFNTNITMLIVTLIAGLFGFMVAVIPFAIQLFNQDNEKKENNFLNKLMKKDKFDFFIKPMFNRFIKMLYLMFILFIYYFILNLIQTIDFKEISFLYEEIFKISLLKLGITVLIYIYLLLIFSFFLMLRNIIRDLQSLVFYFFKSKENDFIKDNNHKLEKQK